MARIEELKTDNIQRVRKCFYQAGSRWTRPQLVKETGLSMAGTENILQILLERGEILYDGDAPSNGGRRSKLYRLDPDYAHAGILLLSHLEQNFTIHAVSLDLEGREIISRGLSVEACPDPEAFLEFCRNFLLNDPQIRSMTVSYPGIVTSEGVAFEGDFPALNGTNLKQMLAAELQVSICIENDVNLGVEGYHIQHPDCDNLAILYQPYYDHAGAGLIVNGRLIRGKSGFAGEVGRPVMEKQMRLLTEDPEQLVRMHLECIAAVAAPDRIAWYCPLPEKDIALSPDIPTACQPILERLAEFNELESLIRAGAEAVGRGAIMQETAFA